MKKGIIISGGEFFEDISVNEDDYVMACDRGYLYAKQLNIKPDLVVGDFDSYDGIIDDSVNFIKYPSAKDDTDTMIAIKKMIEDGFEEIDIYCALGGRLDHLFANITAMVYGLKRGAKIRMIDKTTLITGVYNSKIELDRMQDSSLSVFSFTGISKGVTIKGGKYSLKYGQLTNDHPLGVSNEWEDDLVSISVEDGTLIVICSKIE